MFTNKRVMNMVMKLCSKLSNYVTDLEKYRFFNSGL